MAKYCACRRFSQSCTAPNRMAGGAAAAIGSAALSQMPCENAAKLAAAQIRSTAAIEQQADGVAPPGQQAHQQQRQHDRQNRVGGARRAVAQQPVPRHQLRNGSGNDLDARHDGIERRGKDVAAAGDGRPDHDDAVSNRLRRDRPVQHRGRADGADRTVSAVERDRQNMIDVGPDASSRQRQAIGLDHRLAAGRQRRDAQAGTTVRPCRGFETASARRAACRICPWSG